MSHASANSEPSQATCALLVGKSSSFSAPPQNEHATKSSATSDRAAESSTPRGTLCKADVARDDLTGLVLGQYALGRKVGGGGMGKVFVARHTSLDKTFAIKFVGIEAAARPEARARFEQEVKALGKLQHPHIVNAVDAGCVDGVQYLVTEFVQGEDLAQLVQRLGALPVAEACELIRQAAVGLAHSHRCGFLHRDIKPSNLILDASGTVKVLDFGLVCGPSEHEVTVAGEMLGTWDFVAPEQTQDARSADRRSDLYGLGCTLLYLLSGHAPFSDARYSTPAAKLKGHLFDEPAWFRNIPPHVPKELARVLTRLTAKSPEKRFQNADEVAAALASLAARADLNSLLPVDMRSRGGRPVSPSSTTVKFTTPRSRTPMYIAAAAFVAAVGGLAAMNWSPAAPTPIGQPDLGRDVVTAPSSSSPSPVASQPALTPVVEKRPQSQTQVSARVESSDSGKSTAAPTRVTNETKHTFNAAAIGIGISDQAPAKPARTLSAAP